MPNLDPSAVGGSEEIVLVSAADDAYALPLAVTVRSALDRLGPGRQMQLFVVDGGISSASRDRLSASWRDPRLSVEWLRPRAGRLSGVPVSGHVTASTYLRLILPEVMPRGVDRAIYLDSDMLVRRDLGALWDEPQGAWPLLAVQDQAAPFLDCSTMAVNFDRCKSRLAAVHPVANFRELGLPGNAPYLNGGMLVADLAHWRSEGLSQRLLDCLRDNPEYVLWWDQYALNVVFAGRWRAVDCRWNQGAHIFTYATWRESPMDKQTLRALKNDPWIVHYCSPEKPWNDPCSHPFTAEFRETASRTAWSDWRPKRLSTSRLKLWSAGYRKWRRSLAAQAKDAAEAFSGRRAA